VKSKSEVRQCNIIECRNGGADNCQVEVHGLAADKASVETSIVRNNGFNPRWDETFKFRLTCPQLALVMFRVLDDISAAKVH